MARKEKLKLNFFVNATKKESANGKIQIIRKSLAPSTETISANQIQMAMMILKLAILELVILGLVIPGLVRPGLVLPLEQMIQQHQGEL